jgi:hypothetical protein
MFRVLLLVLGVAVAGANVTNAQVLQAAEDLADDCRHKWPEPNYFHCAGYLTGVLHALQMGLALHRTPGGKFVAVETTNGSGPLCIANSIIPDELAKAFVRFMDRHPEMRRDSPYIVAAQALLALDEAPPWEHVAPIMWEVCGRKK